MVDRESRRAAGQSIGGHVRRSIERIHWASSRVNSMTRAYSLARETCIRFSFEAKKRIRGGLCRYWLGALGIDLRIRFEWYGFS